MSVIYCSRLASGASGTWDFLFNHSYTHEYHIITDDKKDNMSTVIIQSTAVGPLPVPRMGTAYGLDLGITEDNNSYDASSYLIRKDVRRVGAKHNHTHWILTARWEPLADPAQYHRNPFLRPNRYKLDWANYNRIADKDKDGNPITNSAGDQFEASQLQVADARPVLLITRNEYPLEFIIARSIQYRNSVNSDENFFGAKQRQAKMTSITTGDLLSAGDVNNVIPYFEVTYAIEFITQSSSDPMQEDTWDLEIVDRGREYLENGNKFAAKDLPGNRLEWVNLNPNGTRRDPTLPALYKQPPFRVHRELLFENLHLDLPAGLIPGFIP